MKRRNGGTAVGTAAVGTGRGITSLVPCTAVPLYRCTAVPPYRRTAVPPPHLPPVIATAVLSGATATHDCFM
jgi:hypothetical protein